jgi:hypothetical protein
VRTSQAAVVAQVTVTVLTGTGDSDGHRDGPPAPACRAGVTVTVTVVGALLLASAALEARLFQAASVNGRVRVITRIDYLKYPMMTRITHRPGAYAGPA